MEENKKMETRTLEITELRVKRNDGGGSVIEGHAAVFDSWSETLGGIFPFKEKVARGAFSQSIKKDDIRALFNHDPNYVLGRNIAGTLTLCEDDKGLGVKITPPDTQWARDLQVSIDRGDITQMSFGFVTLEDDWRSENNTDVRELRKVKLYDVSPVTYPAYTQTDVGVRGLESYEKYQAEKRAKQEQSDAEIIMAKEKQKLNSLKIKFKNIKEDSYFMDMKKLLAMKAKREDARLKAMAVLSKSESEGRFLTEDEQKEIDKWESEIRSWDESIIRTEKLLAIEPQGSAEDRDNEPEVKPSLNKPDEKRFGSFGDQLMAAYRASAPGGQVDERLNNRAASGLNETTPSDGGFLVQQDFVTELLKRTYETGILATKVKKIPLTTNSNGLKINAIDEDSRANGSRWGGVQTYWESEAAELTASKTKFRQMDLSLKKLTGLCYATDELLQDASALESVIRQAFAEEFGFKIDDSILDGSGAGEPLGILNSGALVTVAKESNQTDKITVENLIKMWNRLWSRSRTNAIWYINQELEPLLYTLKIGDKPVYIPAGGLSEKPYGTIFGRPVVPLEQCNAAGEVGDIVLADISQYLMIDKGGIKSASSIHVRFLYDENVFRFIYRLDGQPVWNKPLTPYKGSASVSPFVALAKRNA